MHAACIYNNHASVCVVLHGGCEAYSCRWLRGLKQLHTRGVPLFTRDVQRRLTFLQVARKPHTLSSSCTSQPAHPLPMSALLRRHNLGLRDIRLYTFVSPFAQMRHWITPMRRALVCVMVAINSHTPAMLAIVLSPRNTFNPNKLIVNKSRATLQNMPS